MESYNKGLQKERDRLTQTNDYQGWAKSNLAKKVAEDEKNLCDVLAQGVNLEMPDFSQLESAWNALNAMMSSNSKGADMSTMINKAIKKGIEKATEKIKEGMCKLGRELGEAASAGINAAQQAAVENAESYADYQKNRLMSKLEEREEYQDYKMVAEGNYEELAWKKLDNKELESRVNERRDKVGDFLEIDI